GGGRGRAGRQGLRHAARDGAPGTRPAAHGPRPRPWRGDQQRRHALGRRRVLRPLLRPLLRAEACGRHRGGGMSDRLDRPVLIALQVLIVGLPLFLGGRQSFAALVAAFVVLGLLALTVRERRRRGGGPHAPGIWALAAFAILVLATTVPLPPTL